MANLTRKGYGQVEVNQMSAQRTGQIIANLPLDSSVKVLENGMFMFADEVANKVTGTSTNPVAEAYLVYNEVKLYKDWSFQKDFAMIQDEFSDNYRNGDYTDTLTGDTVTGGYGVDKSKWTTAYSTEYPNAYRIDGYCPRLFKVNVGDVFTTNMVPTGVEYAAGDVLTPTATTITKDSNTWTVLELTKDSTSTSFPNGKYVVIKATTMPDNQPAVKVQRVA